MKKALFAALALALITGCASTPPAETPSASPGTPGQTPPAPPPSVGVKPLPPGAVQVDPLKDPSSGLSKRSVFYELDKYDVRDEYRPLVQAHAKYLAEHRGTKMLIQGNCDERGTPEYNLGLGERRAERVKEYLTTEGVTPDRLSTVSFGSEHPFAQGHDESAWKQNRRDHLVAATP